MYKILFYEDAENHLYEIQEFISQDNLYFAAKTAESILKSINFLKEFPNIGKNIGGGRRLILDPIYKYKIVYRIDEDIIYIIAIFKYQDLY